MTTIFIPQKSALIIEHLINNCFQKLSNSQLFLKKENKIFCLEHENESFFYFTILNSENIQNKENIEKENFDSFFTFLNLNKDIFKLEKKILDLKIYIFEKKEKEEKINGFLLNKKKLKLISFENFVFIHCDSLGDFHFLNELKNNFRVHFEANENSFEEEMVVILKKSKIITFT